MPKFYVVWRPGLVPPHLVGIDVDGYMVSARNFFKTKNQVVDLHEHLEFKGEIIVDSGAFSFGRKGNFPSCKRLARLQSDLGGDVVVPLDYPLIFARNDKEKVKYQQKTLLNNLKWEKYSREYGFEVLGVIQGTYSDLEYILPAIPQEKIGLGGKAIQPTNGIIYSRKELRKDLLKIKSIDKHRKLHLFGYSGIESYTQINTLLDSFDTLAPQLYAAHGTFLTDYPNTRNPRWVTNQSNDPKDVKHCQCVICKHFGVLLMKRTSISEGLRFLHNTYWLRNFYLQKDLEVKKMKRLDEILGIPINDKLKSTPNKNHSEIKTAIEYLKTKKTTLTNQTLLPHYITE